MTKKISLTSNLCAAFLSPDTQSLRHQVLENQAPENQTKGLAIAMGNFDGIHLGHQAIIAKARSFADHFNTGLGILSFEPHPRRYFHPDAAAFSLMRPEQKAEIFASLGVDVLYHLRFDQTVANLSCQDFVSEILVKALKIAHITIGFDLHFGRGREGTSETLLALSKNHGFEVAIVPAVTFADQGFKKCSSTAVRQALQRGDVALAARLLGRPFRIRSEVIHGDKIGRTLGFPTANLLFGDYVRPMEGIYTARTRLADGRIYDSVAYIGLRPTIKGVDHRLEVHLFDFDEDLYGSLIEVSFLDFLRGDQAFTTLDALKAQIARDCALARARLALPAKSKSDSG